MEKVSIIIPCYNAEKYIKDCIFSALNQVYTNIEVIIVNDGSTDNSLYEINQIQDKRIKVINQSNSGASIARNNGLKHATGDYIQFLDADDILDSYKIFNQMQLLAQSNYSDDILVFGRWLILKEKDIIQPSLNNQKIWHTYQNPIEILQDMVLIGCCLPPIVYLTPRRLLDKAGWWNEELTMNDDGEFFARVITHSQKLVYCEEAASIYRSTPNSLSKRMSDKAATSQIKSLILTAEILKSKPTQQTEKVVKKMITSCLYSFYPYYCSQRKKGEAYLRTIDVSYKLNYPSLTWKEWAYYYIQKLCNRWEKKFFSL